MVLLWFYGTIMDAEIRSVEMLKTRHFGWESRTHWFGTRMPLVGFCVYGMLITCNGGV